MSDDWFSSKIAPDGNVEDGCHPDEAQALKDYLHQSTNVTDAARAITRPVITSSSPKDDLSRLYVLLLDALVELPSHYIDPLLALVQAIEDLPDPDLTAVEQSQRPGDKLWRGLPRFANLWSDVSYRSGSWKMDAEATTGSKRDTLRAEHVRRAHVEARLATAGLAGIPIDWGYEVVGDALESEEALLDFEVPAAAEWLEVCGQRFVEGAEKGEKSYAVKDGVMGMKQWEAWKERLRELQGQEGVVGQAAAKALGAMRGAVGDGS